MIFEEGHVDELEARDLFLKLVQQPTIDYASLIVHLLEYGIPDVEWYGKIWMLLIGLLPVYVDAWSFILQQREETYDDMRSTIVALSDDAQSNTVLHFYVLYNEKILVLQPESYLRDLAVLEKLHTWIEGYCLTEAQTFWCLAGLIDMVQFSMAQDWFEPPLEWQDFLSLELEQFLMILFQIAHLRQDQLEGASCAT